MLRARNLEVFSKHVGSDRRVLALLSARHLPLAPVACELQTVTLGGSREFGSLE